MNDTDLADIFDDDRPPGAPDPRRLLWRRGKAMGFPAVGREGWASFCATGPIIQVAETLRYLDEWQAPGDATPEEDERREREAIEWADAQEARP